MDDCAILHIFKSKGSKYLSHLTELYSLELLILIFTLIIVIVILLIVNYCKLYFKLLIIIILYKLLVLIFIPGLKTRFAKTKPCHF